MKDIHPPGGLSALPQCALLVYPRYQVVQIEEGADLEGVVLFEEYCHLVQVYGNHVHQKDGRHIDGGISDNKVWQLQWQLLLSQLVSRYHTPHWSIGRRYMKFLEEGFHGARERRWNAERPMVFMGVILHTTPVCIRPMIFSAGSRGSYIFGRLGSALPSAQIQCQRADRGQTGLQGITRRLRPGPSTQRFSMERSMRRSEGSGGRGRAGCCSQGTHTHRPDDRSLRF